MSVLRMLMVGDVAGKSGLYAMRKVLPRLVADRGVDFVVANGENVAGGVGITPELTGELLSLGIDVITTGNHIWRQREIRPYIEDQPRLLRPANFSSAQPGRGFGVFETAAGIRVGVLNLAGQVFMDPADSPFRAADEALGSLRDARLVLVDFHAEVTSEKKAMAIHLDGRVTAVVGTHTHVQTADEQIQEGGTAFITDLGMTGPHDSVIGMRKDLVVDRFVTGMPHSFKPAKGGVRFQAALIEADPATGRATGMERIDVPVE
jgi:metallophosphoesterase (TIGR00282 family)